MENEIGNIAGEIWRYLEEVVETTSFDIKIKLAISNSELFLSLGWLAKERKIVLEKLEKGYKIKKL